MFMRAIHPGIVLKDELEEVGITPNRICASDRCAAQSC